MLKPVDIQIGEYQTIINHRAYCIETVYGNTSSENTFYLGDNIVFKSTMLSNNQHKNISKPCINKKSKAIPVTSREDL
jgi:hypothetical protein